MPKKYSKYFIKVFENDYTRDFILRFAKAKNGDTVALDMLLQNVAGMKTIFS